MVYFLIFHIGFFLVIWNGINPAKNIFIKDIYFSYQLRGSREKLLKLNKV